MASLDTHYSARDIETRILAAVRAAGLRPEQGISPEELGALDHFHKAGLRASFVRKESAQIRAEDRVHDLLGQCGLVAEYFGDASDGQLPPPASGTPESGAQAPLSLSVYVDNLTLKVDNAARILREGRIRLVRGIFRVK